MSPGAEPIGGDKERLIALSSASQREAFSTWTVASAALHILSISSSGPTWHLPFVSLSVSFSFSISQFFSFFLAHSLPPPPLTLAPLSQSPLSLQRSPYHQCDASLSGDRARQTLCKLQQIWPISAPVGCNGPSMGHRFPLLREAHCNTGSPPCPRPHWLASHGELLGSALLRANMQTHRQRSVLAGQE